MADNTVALSLLKQKLGITSNARDDFLNAILNGIQKELDQVHGIKLDSSDPAHLMFLVDLADWRYTSRGEMGSMPEHLMFRLKNLYIRGSEVSDGGNL